jgi:hypothetical protein
MIAAIDKWKLNLWRRVAGVEAAEPPEFCGE